MHHQLNLLLHCLLCHLAGFTLQAQATGKGKCSTSIPLKMATASSRRAAATSCIALLATRTDALLLPPLCAGPIASLGDHLSNPFGANWASNIGHCVVPQTVDVQGLTIPLTCLWPGQH